MSVTDPKEVKAARAKLQARSAEAWNKVEAAGRSAREAEGAQGTKAEVKASADDDAAKKRQAMTA